MTTKVQDLQNKLVALGATGRIGAIITPEGYDKLIDHYEANDMEKIEILHRYLGWMLEMAPYLRR